MHCGLAPGNGTVNNVEVGEACAAFTLRPFTCSASGRLPDNDCSARRGGCHGYGSCEARPMRYAIEHHH